LNANASGPDRHRIAALQSHSLTLKQRFAVATVEPQTLDVPWFGKWFYHLVPYRRGVVLNNLRRVFGEVLPETEIIRIAQAFYGHYVRFFFEIVKLPFMSAEQKKKFIRFENVEAIFNAHKKGKGHSADWTFRKLGSFHHRGIAQFPQFKGLFRFVQSARRVVNRLVTRRFRRAGFGAIDKQGSLTRSSTVSQ
jgi:KDO2-lipid IV(A) lauroyltransferase